MAKKKLSARAIARVLGIHHSTWQGYLAGKHRPDAAIRKKIRIMMQEENFESLVAAAVRYYRGII